MMDAHMKHAARKDASLHACNATTTTQPQPVRPFARETVGYLLPW